MLFKKKEFSIDLETCLIIDESVIDCYGGGKGASYQPPEPQPIVSPTPPIEEASVELDEEEKEKKTNSGKGQLKVPLSVGEKAGLNIGNGSSGLSV